MPYYCLQMTSLQTFYDFDSKSGARITSIAKRQDKKDGAECKI